MLDLQSHVFWAAQGNGYEAWQTRIPVIYALCMNAIYAWRMSAKKKTVHGRGPSNINLGKIYV